MTLDKAVRHIIWRFQGNTPIKINSEDRLALNRIIDHLNEEQESNFKNNIHFAKLYVFSLNHFLNKFDTTIDNPIPHKELDKLLHLPFNYFISDLTHSMNQRIRYQILKNAGCNLDIHPRMKSKEESSRNLKNLEKILAIRNNYRFFMNGAWTEEEIEKGIKSKLKILINDL